MRNLRSGQNWEGAGQETLTSHLAGVDLAKIGDDLIATDIGELLANKVNDHLVDVSVGEWLRLRARVTFYMADDNTALSADPTEIEG